MRDLRFQVVQTDESVAEFDYPYAIVMTQDCDLEHAIGAKFAPVEKGEVHNQFLPNVLLTPAFPADIARSGEHLLDIFGVRQDRINSDRWKLVSQNREDRYHHLLGRQDLQIPEVLIDFKQYFTIPRETVFSRYPYHYLATVNELFREELSRRFCAYLARIGLPELS